MYTNSHFDELTWLFRKCMGDLTGEICTNFVPSGIRENPLGGKASHANPAVQTRAFVTMLRQIEVGVATVSQVFQEGDLQQWRHS
jgi:hypothetical protein